MNSKIKAWVKLYQTLDMSFTKAKALIDKLGKPETYIGKGENVFEEMSFLTVDQRKALSSSDEPSDWTNICRLMERYNINFVSYLDEDYPERLREVYNPPLLLFYRGQLNRLEDKRSIAVVGTRKPDNYGQMMTKQITEDLVRAGFIIVSGLAYGVDSVAHNVVVDNDSRTIAVMGTSCENIYPSRNIKLAKRIVENGVIISEHIPGTKAEKWFFSARNRIISGLSLGTFVVQGDRKSGALVTAKYALDQNRDLFALPGDINRAQSEGPNYLIKLGAKIVTSSEDILEEYDSYLFPEEKKQVSLNKSEELVLKVIKNNRPEIDYDNIVIQTGLSVGELSAVILSLEMKNLIYVGNANMVSAKD